MSQGRESLLSWDSENPSATADVLTATGDHAGTFKVSRPITVLAIAATITTAVVSSGAVVVKADKRPTTGSDASRGNGDVGVLTIPAGTAAGKVVRSASTRINLNPGDEVVFEVTTAAAGGGAAGGAQYHVHYVPRAESVGNLPDVVVSAT